MYIPKYFTLKEFLPQNFYEKNKHKGQNLWFLFDERILQAADALREEYGKMVANTWAYGGTHHYRGWRPLNCKVGAEFSQHKYGRALDLVPVFAEVDHIRDDIASREIGAAITCIEEDVSWLHIDCRNWSKGLFIMKP